MITHAVGESVKPRRDCAKIRGLCGSKRIRTDKRRCDLESTYLSANSIIARDSASGSPGTHVL